MKNEFVPYEQALALKELGFDEPVLAKWIWDECPELMIKGNKYMWTEGEIKSGKIKHWKAPLYQQAFRWFREKYGLISYVHPLALLQDTKKWCYEITNFESSWDEDSDLHTLEEAELACLLELINICKKK